MGVFNLKKCKQEIVEKLGAAQNALIGREDLMDFFGQKNEMTSAFQLAHVNVTKKQMPYEYIQQ